MLLINGQLELVSIRKYKFDVIMIETCLPITVRSKDYYYSKAESRKRLDQFHNQNRIIKINRRQVGNN